MNYLESVQNMVKKTLTAGRPVGLQAAEVALEMNRLGQEFGVQYRYEINYSDIELTMEIKDVGFKKRFTFFDQN